MQIEEIMKFGGIAATLIGTAVAAIIRSKKDTDREDEVDLAALAKEMKELQIVLHTLRSEVKNKHATKLDHIEEDVSRLFDKTDKLTDILIEYFSKQSNK